MWLITPLGFFSVVQKPDDVSTQTLTVRARVRSDLEALRDQHLPELGDISESVDNDYRFRARAPQAAVAQALAQLVLALDYSNFKSEVARVQGHGRAGLYHDVWAVLYRLQTLPNRFAGRPAVAAPAGAATDQPAPTAAGTIRPVYHPRPDEHGRPLRLTQPSQPTPLACWFDPQALACVVPNGPMPPVLNGVPVAPWPDAPESADAAAWEALAAARPVDEPAFQPPAGYKKAAGVVVREPDGRCWVVAPSNRFAGYRATFAKGTVEPGRSLQATALLEAFEESGLRVRLLSHLLDLRRSQSYTRYYLAERIGGHPGDMGWESQAVMLVPAAQWPQVLAHPNDQPLVRALARTPPGG